MSFRKTFGRFLLVLGWSCLAFATVARAEVVTIDATTPAPAPAALPFASGGKSPDGHTLAVNSRYFTLDGQPWFPVMGEFHFSRYPADEWETELEKMKAGGITVVSTYVFWIFHEESQGQFDWSGQRDLHRFVALCQKHGLYVWLRVGPWAHGEVRNGGFPDWLLTAAPRRRTNDPAYLGFVETFFNQIGQQVKGQSWADGGPIIGVQLENEYHPGGNGGVPHMQRLLQLAKAAGITAPFYSATGWDNAVVPTTDFLPVFGGYTEQFWSNSLKELPPNGNFFFTNIRAEDNVMGDLSPKNPGYNAKYDGYPFLTAEMGGGMAIAYHRRPLMGADDSTVAALVKVGSGITGLGYYMYHGGTNPDGKTSLEESLGQPDGNGYNDMETKSYDFQAPLGEFGQVNPSYHTMRLLNLFLDDFGDRLAPMTAHFPDKRPANNNDATTPRVTARTDGDHGFVFISNYERNYPLGDKKDFQVVLKLPGGEMKIPRQPVTIPDGAYAIWPVNLDLGGGVTLCQASAQLVTKLDDPDIWVFFATPGVSPEFVFQIGPNDQIDAHDIPGAVVKREADNIVLVSGLMPGFGTTLRLTRASGKTTQLLLLNRSQVLDLQKSRLVDGRNHLVLLPAHLHTVLLNASDVEKFQARVFPSLSHAGRSFTEGIFQSFSFEQNFPMPYAALETIMQTKEAAPSVPAKLNPNPKRRVAMEPGDADFDRAAVWAITLPVEAQSASSGRLMLQIDYEGDVARLYAGDRLITDNFYKGTSFEIGLWRLTPEELKNGLTLKILPLRADTPLYLPPGARPAFPAGADALRLKSVRLAPIYETSLNVSAP